jgi:hypothetical protein
MGMAFFWLFEKKEEGKGERLCIFSGFSESNCDEKRASFIDSLM